MTTDPDLDLAVAHLEERVVALNSRLDAMAAAHREQHALLALAQEKYEATAAQWREAANDWRGQLTSERTAYVTVTILDAELNRLEAGRQTNADRITLLDRQWAAIQGVPAQLDASAKAISALQLWQANAAGRASTVAAIVAAATSLAVGFVVYFVTHGLH